jgi:hypothetical protein
MGGENGYGAGLAPRGSLAAPRCESSSGRSRSGTSWIATSSTCCSRPATCTTLATRPTWRRWGPSARRGPLRVRGGTRAARWARCAPLRVRCGGRGTRLRGRAGSVPDGGLLVARALTYCDLTTGPTGEEVGVSARLVELGARLGDDDPTVPAVRREATRLAAVVDEMESLLAAAR